MSVVVAVVGACAEVARGTLVSGETVASTIVAVSLIVTVSGASQQGAIESREALLAVAGHIQCANTISRAIVGANAGLALDT